MDKLDNRGYIEKYLQALKHKNKSQDTLRVFRSTLYMVFLPFLEQYQYEIDQAESRHLLDFLTYLDESTNRFTGKPLADRTRNNYVSTIKAFYSFLYKNGYIVKNPTLDLTVEVSQKLPVYLTESEMNTYLNIVAQGEDSENQVIVHMMYGTGIRVGELVKIKVKDIMSNGKIKIMGKGRKQRVVTVPKRSLILVQNYVDTQKLDGDSLLLPNLTTPAGVRKRIKKITGVYNYLMKERGNEVKNVTPHKFRHTFCSHVTAHGMKIEDAALIMGHAKVTTTQIYTHKEEDALMASVQKCHPLGH